MSNVLGDQPVGYWRVDDASGTSIADRSGHANTGGFASGVTLGAAGLVSDSDLAAGFSGGHVQVPTTADLSFGPNDCLNIEAWIKTTSASNQVIFVQQQCTAGALITLVGVRDRAAAKVRLLVDGVLLQEVVDSTSAGLTAPITQTWIGQKWDCGGTFRSQASSMKWRCIGPRYLPPASKPIMA